MDIPKDDVDTAEKRRPRSPARPARPAVPSAPPKRPAVARAAAPRRLNGLKTPAMAPQVGRCTRRMGRAIGDGF